LKFLIFNSRIAPVDVKTILPDWQRNDPEEGSAMTTPDRPLQQQLASDNYADLCPEALAALETDRWSGLTAFQRWSVGTRTGS